MEKNKLFIFGLDDAGKTALVNKLMEQPEPGVTSASMNFEINELMIRTTEFLIWTAPGQVRYRELWKRGLDEVRIICFVLDTSDAERFEEAHNELKNVLYKSLDTPLIICFHKIDLETSKKNLSQAQELFSKKGLAGHPVYRIQTSIYLSETMEDFKDMLVEIIEKQENQE